MIKAVIFDCDGLIIDTESALYKAYCDLYADYKKELPLELFVQCVGSSVADFDPVVHLEEIIGEKIDQEEANRIVKEKHLTNVEGEQLRPGVENYLKAAKAHGLKIGLASSSGLDWVMKYLNKYDIAQYFDSVLTKDHVSKIKPDPELYLKSFEKLGVSPDEALIFEDSLNGLKAAKGAGAYCVIVPNEVTANLPFENHDLRLTSMEEIELEELIKKW